MSPPVLELQGVVKQYPGEPPVEALRGVSLTIRQGELVAVVGQSGSGKTTMVHVMGTLERPTSGVVLVAGKDVSEMTDRELSGLRAWQLGFVFQQFFLLDGLSVVENVANGLLYRAVNPAERRRLAVAALERVGLGHRLAHHPNKLSGGERQRVAIARAVVGEPAVVLADEPTGNLDSASGASIMALLTDLNEEGRTILVITHNHEIADSVPRSIELRDGLIVGDATVAPRWGRGSR
jgi:putative ABC transport system ATP-binding protein